MGFQRDNILSDDERAKSARKCLTLLFGKESEMREKDRSFYLNQTVLATQLEYRITEPQLQWLRDLVDRY